MSFSLVENAKIVNVLSPKDMNGLAMTALYVDVRKAAKATFILQTGVLTATSAAAITLMVANDVAGTKSKTIGASTDLGLAHYYKRAISTDTWTKTTVTASTFNLVSTDDGAAFLLEVDTSKMGWFTSTSVAYQATHVRLCVATPGAHVALMSAQCILTGLRYAEDVPPTAIL